MTKILPTIGPISDSENNLRKVLKFTDTVRLNGSHNNLNWHIKVSSLIKKIDSNCKILIDVPGVKPRTENLDNIEIRKNQKVLFFFKKKPRQLTSDLNKVFVKISNPLPYFSKIKLFSVSDGNYIFRFTKKGKNYLEGMSLQNFVLLPKKGLNVPGSLYSDKLQLKVYLNFISKIKKVKFDAVGLSFIQNDNVLKILRKKYPQLTLISKIENLSGIKNIEKIVKASDAIMIDRGDLSAEIGNNQLYNSIINISNISNYLGKPLIMATENLFSMQTNSSPSKSEIISLAFSNQIQSDQIMLSDETATSKNWLKILYWLKDFISSSNKFNMSKRYKNNIDLNNNIFNNIFKSLENTTLIIFTKKGYIINKILSSKKKNKFFVFSDNKKVINQSFFSANCTAFLTKRFPKNMESFIFNNIKKKKKLIFKSNLSAFLTYVNYPKKGSRANTLSLIKKNIFNN